MKTYLNRIKAIDDLEAFLVHGVASQLVGSFQGLDDNLNRFSRVGTEDHHASLFKLLLVNDGEDVVQGVGVVVGVHHNSKDSVFTSKFVNHVSNSADFGLPGSHDGMLGGRNRLSNRLSTIELRVNQSRQVENQTNLKLSEVASRHGIGAAEVNEMTKTSQDRLLETGAATESKIMKFELTK